ncbi:MAG: serine/threonine protein kinase, partial [Myxococcales bacterium]|nr:serine/threonine protein kinase [Myxococcales bacterium]
MVHRGESFGEYRLIRRLGVGGMAEAFVAERDRPGGVVQRVCLKRILPAHGDNPDFRAMFVEEARLAASLRHSNVVGVIDFGEVQGVHFLALELVEGADLRAIRRDQGEVRLGPELTAQIITEVATGLDYAHRRGSLVHRDVSPSNVLISYEGEVKLSDFGIAKATSGATSSGLIKGKVPYMAPEQARAEGLDGRADLFSLGVMMHELLCGRRPFAAPTEILVLQRILSGEREPVARTCPDASPQLVA